MWVGGGVWWWTTFNNISVISWRSVLLVEETGVPAENIWSSTNHWQTLSHNIVSSTFELTVLVVIDTDCIGTCSYKFNIRSRLRRLPFLGGRYINSVSPTKHLISIIFGCTLFIIKKIINLPIWRHEQKIIILKVSIMSSTHKLIM
jgi:hypothetical protein